MRAGRRPMEIPHGSHQHLGARLACAGALVAHPRGSRKDCNAKGTGLFLNADFAESTFPQVSPDEWRSQPWYQAKTLIPLEDLQDGLIGRVLKEKGLLTQHRVLERAKRLQAETAREAPKP